LLNRKSFKTQPEARTAVFEFIEGWYNPHRCHSAIDYLSPNDYERRHAAGPNIEQQRQTSAPPPLATGKIEDNVIEGNCIGEAPNQSPSPAPFTETGRPNVSPPCLFRKRRMEPDLPAARLGSIFGRRPG
jgi:hypothetical protein